MQRVRTITLIYFIYALLVLVNSSFCNKKNNNNNFISRGLHIWHSNIIMVLRYKNIYVQAFDNNKTMKIIYSMYRAGGVSVHRACCERATPPYLLGRGGMIYPGSRPAGVTTCSLRMVTECFLTRSMLIKMYKLPSHGICLYMYIVFTVSQFHADVHSVYLVFQFA